MIPIVTLNWRGLRGAESQDHRIPRMPWGLAWEENAYLLVKSKAWRRQMGHTMRHWEVARVDFAKALGNTMFFFTGRDIIIYIERKCFLTLHWKINVFNWEQKNVNVQCTCRIFDCQNHHIRLLEGSCLAPNFQCFLEKHRWYVLRELCWRQGVNYGDKRGQMTLVMFFVSPSEFFHVSSRIAEV